MSLSIPQELIEQLKKGNVVLFCGAGISISPGGLPSGKQLARELAERAGEPELVNASLPEVAQAYELKMGHQSLIEYIANRIDDPRYIPLRTHQLIAALPFTNIVTTNWDNLLEEALRQACKPFVKVVQDSNVAYADEQKVLLIKLHGSIEQRDSMVITGDDYYDVFAWLPETANLVRGYFAIRTIFFLGFGLADEDFKRLYHEVVRHIGVHKRRAYAVQLDPDELTVKHWEKKNVQIIAADAMVFLQSLADALGKEIVPVVPSPEPKPNVARQPRRIDAALPSQAQVGQSIDLVIAVKLPESPKLYAREIRDAGISRRFPDDAKVEPKPVEVEFPVDERTGQPGAATLEIRVIAPNFDIHGSKRKRLLVPPDRDSELCTFLLSPRTPGELEVSVELYSQGVLVGTMRLETVVHPHSVPIDRRAAMIWTVATLPLVLVIIAPGGGIALAASQLPSTAPDGRYQIHLEDRTEGVVIGDAAQVTQHFDVPPAREDVGRLSAVEERAALERELALHRRTLFRLREQLAIFPVGDQPVHLLTQVEDEEQKIVNIEAKLQQLNEAIKAEAQRQRQLAELYSQGMGCFQGGDWAQAIHFFQQILDVDRDYRDTPQRLTQAEKQERLEQLYARIKQAEANQDWQQMIRVCQEIISIAPFYRDVQRLLRKARFHSARQRVGVICPRYKIVIGLLVVLLLIGVGLTVSGRWNVGWQPTPALPTAQVSIEAFLITKRGSPTVTAKPGTTITATVEAIVHVEVDISTTGQEQEALVFTWYTCSEGDKPVVRKIGNPEMLYVAPSEPGIDCICVFIEKGGVQLDRGEIFVDVQE